MQKFFEFRLTKEKKKRKIVDSYQESLNKLGREQLKTLLRKGLQIQFSV